MILQSRNFVYGLVFSLSFFILTLQIYLSSLLRYLLQLPFYAVSFAFLGLSAAGIFTYLSLNKKETKLSPVYLAGLMNAFNITLMVYVFFGTKVAKWLETFKGDQSFSQATPQEGFSMLLDNILFDILFNSVYYGLFISVSFFFLGAAVAYLYKMYANNAPRLYLFDLLGASAGCLAATPMLRYIQFSSIPLLMGCLCAFLTYFVLLDCPKARYSKYLTIILFIAAAFSGYLNKKTAYFDATNNPHFAVLDYEMKDKVDEFWHAWNEYSRLSLIRHQKDGQAPEYLFTIDGGRGNAHLRTYDKDNPYYFNLYDQFTAVSMPYLLGVPKDILIIFAGAGIDMLHANSFSQGQSDITGIELNPMIVETAVQLPEFHLKEFFNLDHIHMRVQEGRSFLESNKKKFDTIIFSWGGASFANYLGTSGYTGRFLYTTESMKSVMRSLKPDGTISIVNTNKARLAAVMKVAFEELGHKDFYKHVVILDRKQDIYTVVHEVDFFSIINRHIILFKMSPFTPEEIAAIRQNVDKQNLAVVYTPGDVHPDFKIYEEVLLKDHTVKVMEDLSRKYLLDLTVTTDNRPFIENGFYAQILFKKIFWQNIDRLSNQESTKHYTLNLYTIWFILFLFLLAFGFILLPLLLTQKITTFKQDFPYLHYFSVLGVGFILIEIAVMNQFILFLGNPIYSYSLILASLLISSGLGSYASNALFDRKILCVRSMAVVCFGMLIAYYFLLPQILRYWLGAGFGFKMGITFLIILPMGFCLGMMFPQGLKKLSAYNNDMIPWAWGLNGYMSTVGSAVSIYLSMMTGFNWLILIAAVLYLSIFFIFKEPSNHRIP